MILTEQKCNLRGRRNVKTHICDAKLCSKNHRMHKSNLSHLTTNYVTLACWLGILCFFTLLSALPSSAFLAFVLPPFLPFLSYFLPFLCSSTAPFSLRSFISLLPSFIAFFLAFVSFLPEFLPSFFSFNCRWARFLYLCLLAAYWSLVAFTYARLPRFARLLPSLLLACCLYFCSLALAILFRGFVKCLVDDHESLYLHFGMFLNTSWRHTCQF